jgi:hypothetical protein
VRPKFSRDLLNLRKIQETLARQKECVLEILAAVVSSLISIARYAEAHKIKVKADNLEAWEREKLRMEHSQGASSREGKLRAHQTSEVTALRKRIQTTREELKKQRQVELERFVCHGRFERCTVTHSGSQSFAAVPERQGRAGGAAAHGAPARHQVCVQHAARRYSDELPIEPLVTQQGTATRVGE